MLITCVHVKDFKRIREVRITPDADRELLVIGGNNANGKTSLLDALRAAFGGKAALPADPVRHGADEASITVQLDNGLTVTRTVDKDGDSKLEVRDQVGAVKSPQAVLDKLVAGGRFLDPLAFLAMKPPEQRAELLRLVDREGKVAELDQQRQRVFDARTETGRDHKRTLAQLQTAPSTPPGELIDVSKLVEQLNELSASERQHDQAANRLGQAEMSLTRERGALEGCRERLRALQAEIDARVEAVRRGELAVDEARAELQAAGAAKDTRAERDRVQANIQSAQQHNHKVATASAAHQQYKELSNLAASLGGRIEEMTAKLEAFDTQKAEILGAAKLPVAGLGVSADGVTLTGVPLAQASAAERLRVALALAIAANPELRDIWVRDAAVLDDESLAGIAEFVRAAGCRAWVERVGSRDPGAVIIRDGRVAETTNGVSPNQEALFR